MDDLDGSNVENDDENARVIEKNLQPQVAIENGQRNSWFTYEKWWLSIVM